MNSNPFLRGLIEGTAGLFDIFGISTARQRRGTPEDDARELRDDVERIAQDFDAVLSTIGPSPKK